MASSWDLSRWVAPKDCLVCEAFDQGPVCLVCQGELELLPGHGCKRCANPEVAANAISCPFCQGLDVSPVAIVTLYHYRGCGQELFQLIKYHGYWRLIEGLLLNHAETLLANLDPSDYEAIVAVPESPIRRMSRFYNPANEIARVLSRLTGLPQWNLLAMNPLRRRQTGLGGAERKANASRGIRLRTRPPHALILVDDVLTTGSTLSAAHKLLARSGAERMAWFSLFRKV